MIKSILVKRDDAQVIYTLAGAEEIQLTGAVIKIKLSASDVVRTISFNSIEAAEAAFNEIADWLAENTAQLVMAL